MKTGFIASVAIACLLTGVSQPAVGAMISWADWMEVTSPGNVSGMIGALPITYSGETNPAAQTSGGINYWNPDTPYISNPVVDNAPPASDIIRLTGGNTTENTITFVGMPVTDPVMAIVSLGTSSQAVQYVFDTPFDVLSSGPGFWGGPGTLTNPSGNILEGVEGHGTIQFLGSLSSISWTVPNGEFWHGFTVGTASVIPLPASVFLFGSGLLALFGRRLGSFKIATLGKREPTH